MLTLSTYNGRGLIMGDRFLFEAEIKVIVTIEADSIVEAFEIAKLKGVVLDVYKKKD